MKPPLAKRPTLRLTRPLAERPAADDGVESPVIRPELRTTKLRLDPAKLAPPPPRKPDPDSQAILDELGRLGLADPD